MITLVYKRKPNLEIGPSEFYKLNNNFDGVSRTIMLIYVTAKCVAFVHDGQQLLVLLSVINTLITRKVRRLASSKTLIYLTIIKSYDSCNFLSRQLYK